jgi:putative nucleotidyltransferase with HDIG domain
MAVAACAELAAGALELDRGLLVSSAWLHDVGYAPELVETGFHPLDGGRHLRKCGVDERVVNLVAHHSCARYEASLRGFREQFDEEFPAPAKEYEDALCYCDMTNGPAGDPVPAPDRLDEIQVRYGPKHLVTRFVDDARPEILASVRRVETKLRLSGSLESRR